MKNDKIGKIKILPDGPYQISGANLQKMKPVLNSAGRPQAWEFLGPIEAAETYELCRCGASSNKPFCDWTHVTIEFNGKETAQLAPSHSRAKYYEGKGLIMLDDKPLCIHAGFCVSEKTDVWELIEQAQDGDSRAEIIRIINLCPSGRLAYQEVPQGPIVEEDLPQGIGIIEDGPIYVRGGIPVEGANGQNFEKQNRMTLCRCGASKNKPFCDGTHTDLGFKDGI